MAAAAIVPHLPALAGPAVFDDRHTVAGDPLITGAADDPGTAAVARTALSELGLSVPTRTIPRRKCRRLG